MPPTRLVSDRQMELLVQLAEQNLNDALNNPRSGRSCPLTQQAKNKAWADMAIRLNSVGDGVTKSPELWKKYWHLLKFRTKSKASGYRRQQESVDETKKLPPLTGLEERIVCAVNGVKQPRRSAAKTALKHHKYAAYAKKNSVTENQRLEAALCTSEEDALQSWVHTMEERRTTAEERMTDAVVSLAATNRGIVGCLQQMAAAQTQMIELLQRLQPR